MMLTSTEDDTHAALSQILSYHERRFLDKAQARKDHERRHVGLELKFPVVDDDGEAVAEEVIDEFWQMCQERGWEPIDDSHSNDVVGVRDGDETNPDMIRTTTGFCVLEYSLAHQPDLFAVQSGLRRFAEMAVEMEHALGARLLGLGIHPITPPSRDLRATKGRHLFWDEVLPPRDNTPHDCTGNVDLFTVIADNQVHLDVDFDEAVDAINALNAVAPALLAVTANSTIWNAEVDDRHLAVRELFWDWWVGNTDRCGLPPEPFEDFADYVETTVSLQPIYIKRDGDYLGLSNYGSFLEYYADSEACAVTAEGTPAPVTPNIEDIDLHDRAFWWNARLSRFGTAESRVCCQQPPEHLLAPAAVSLGIVENLDEATELKEDLSWEQLHRLRVDTAHSGLEAEGSDVHVAEVAEAVLSIAERGLRDRGLGEEQFLEPLWARVDGEGRLARQARNLFDEGGIDDLLDEFALTDVESIARSKVLA